MKCDYHIHTYYSDDSSTPMERQVKRACELGLDEICFTEHVDYGVKFDHDDPESYGHALNADYPEYFAEIERMREKYAGRIKINAGLEFGVQSHTAGRFEALYDCWREKLDFILLSIHQVNDLAFWNQHYQQGRTQDEYQQAYYGELLRSIQCYHDYSVLAHLDLIVRYDLEGEYPFSKVKDIVAEILTTAIKDGKGIELNTSSWHYGLKDTQPSREILKLYHDLGGEILTIGSDAHSPEYIYDHIDDARDILRGIGFRRYCTFEKMKPLYHEL